MGGRADGGFALVVYMGRTGWRHRVTSKRFKGEEPTDGPPGPDWLSIIENVDVHLDAAGAVIPGPYTLKVLSLHQPYASLIFLVKRHDTRGWPWPEKLMGVQVGIHATAAIPHTLTTELDPVCCDLFGANWRQTLPRGAILGTVTPQRCGPVEGMPPESAEDVYAGDWTPGRFATRMGSRSRWAAPIRTKGQQGFWTITTDQLNESAKEPWS